MSRYKTIQYMVDPEVNLVYSRVGNEIAIPMLDWEHMKPSNRYEIRYGLEKCNVFEAGLGSRDVIHTRKIPLHIKNHHRRFWGMRSLSS